MAESADVERHNVSPAGVNGHVAMGEISDAPPRVLGEWHKSVVI
ncbi:MAG: hypothetical protein ABSF46_04625 [Terriglobia bacterium]